MRRVGLTPSIVPPAENNTVYLVLDDLGRSGRVWPEADAEKIDLETVIGHLLSGQYKDPLRVIGFNTVEGWSQDVSEAMACKVLELAERDDYELTEGTLAFVEAHSPRVVQPTLPLW